MAQDHRAQLGVKRCSGICLLVGTSGKGLGLTLEPVGPIFLWLSMDWFKGEFAGNHRCSHLIWGLNHFFLKPIFLWLFLSILLLPKHPGILRTEVQEPLILLLPRRRADVGRSPLGIARKLPETGGNNVEEWAFSWGRWWEMSGWGLLTL